MDEDPKEAENYDEVMAFGRMLYEELRDTSFEPTLKARTNVFSGEVEAYIRLEGPSDQAVTPDVMKVLSSLDLSIRPTGESDNEWVSEWAVDISDEVYDAYKRAVDDYGVPKPPRKWNNSDRSQWSYERITQLYGPDSQRAKLD